MNLDTKVFIYCIFLSLTFLYKSYSQDAHFSQSFSSPLHINPAMTGLIDGSYRVSAIYRDQWRTILEDPIRVYSAAGDVRFLRGNTSRIPDYIGAGLQFDSDRIGLFDFNTTRIGIFGAYHKSLSQRNEQYLSVGFSMSMVQRNVNYENLDFPDEFNGVNAYDFGSKEILPPNNFGFGDFTLGLHYTFPIGNSNRAFAGVAIHHLAVPNISFYRDQTVNFPNSEMKLFRKIVYHISLSHSVNNLFSMIPRIIFIQQGPHQIAQAGSNFRVQNREADGKAYQFGAWLRAVKNEENFQLESAVLMFGIELNGLLLGLSYDANLDDLTNEFKAQGVFEFSITFVGEYENEVNFCPEF